MAVTDAPVSLEFDPTDLQTVKKIKYPNTITQNGGQELFSTAHPATASDGSTINYVLELNLNFGGTNRALIVRTEANLNRSVVGSVAVAGIPYVHDISVTDRYAVLAVWSLRLPYSALVKGKGFLPQLEWCPVEQPETKIYVFDLLNAQNGGADPLATFDAPAMFSYHHINAFESAKGDIVMDVSGYRDPAIINGQHGFAYLANVKSAELRKKQERDAKWMRFVLPVSSQLSGRVQPRELRACDELGQHYTAELVTINPLYARKQHRYSYGFTGFAGVGANAGGFEKWAIIKLDHNPDSSDVGAPTVKVWAQNNLYPSEPIFVPSPEGGAAEDDGVILSQVFDADRRDSFLLVLDAVSLKELGRAYLGMVCPLSFHGMWVG